jgi:hypothetical protein
MGRDVAVAGRARVAPTPSVDGMQAMPLFPYALEFAFGDKRNEVHVAEFVCLASCERAEKDETEEGRARYRLGEPQDVRPLSQTLTRAARASLRFEAPGPNVRSGHDEAADEIERRGDLKRGVPPCGRLSLWGLRRRPGDRRIPPWSRLRFGM